MLNSALARAKDAALAKTMLLLLRPKLSRYGELQQLNLDTNQKRRSGVLLLHGDTEPVTISEVHYEIQRREAEAFLVLHSVKASREWIQNLLDDHLHRLPIKLPEIALRLLE
jgi:hypothetical protein